MVSVAATVSAPGVSPPDVTSRSYAAISSANSGCEPAPPRPLRASSPLSCPPCDASRARASQDGGARRLGECDKGSKQYNGESRREGAVNRWPQACAPAARALHARSTRTEQRSRQAPKASSLKQQREKYANRELLSMILTLSVNRGSDVAGVRRARAATLWRLSATIPERDSQRTPRCSQVLETAIPRDNSYCADHGDHERQSTWAAGGGIRSAGATGGHVTCQGPISKRREHVNTTRTHTWGSRGKIAGVARSVCRPSVCACRH